MLLTVTQTESGPTPKNLRRHWNDIHREAAVFAGDYWHTRFRPLHFKNLATRRYGYQPRQGEALQGAKGFRRSYTGQKLQMFGHTRPLVYTGQSETLSEQRTIVATAKGGQFGSATASVRMPTSGLNRRSSPRSPNMAQELRTVIPEEIDEIGQAVRAFLAQRYGQIRTAP